MVGSGRSMGAAMSEDDGRAASRGEAVLQLIPRELDAEGWTLHRDAVDVRVYSRFGACDAPVRGFKTVSEHAVPAGRMARFLGDVPAAFERTNPTYAEGGWLDPIDGMPVARTCFDLPFPLANRAFTHGVVTAQREDVWLVGYVPLEADEFEAPAGYLSNPIHPSGQRITALGPGRCRVEHLMVYALGGRISHRMQDRWLLGGHVRAYVDEWRRLRPATLPASSAVDLDTLLGTCRDLMNQGPNWTTVVEAPAERIAWARVPICSREAFYTTVEVEASVTEVTAAMGDGILDALKAYNSEFRSGAVLETLAAGPERAAWVLETRFGTPPPLADRHYVYLLARIWDDDGTGWVLHHSVAADPPPPGTVRALMYCTAHRFTARPDGGTRIEHVILTDLGGRMGRWQDRWLRGALTQAYRRDNAALRALFDR